MTNIVAHIRKRDGVFHYERRVPLRVQRDARRFADLFGSKPLYRRTLGTKDQEEALTALVEANREFEAMIRDPAPIPASGIPAPPKRVLTDHDLSSIAEQYKSLTAGPFEKLHLRSNVDPLAAVELERMEYELEVNAGDIQKALRTRAEVENGPVLHPVSEARHIVAEQGFAAPEGSAQLGAIIAAVRAGVEQGYARITALATGEAIPALPAHGRPPGPHSTLTLGEAVNRCLEARKPSARAISETRLALRQFESVVGNKSLSALSRDDFHKYAEHLSNQKVGGKSAGSVRRHLSIQSIQKRLRMLSGAINHARDRGWYSGENLALGVRVKSLAKMSDKAAMPDKRRFQEEELNLVFSHPWFTGCKSPTERHLPGSHRLDGSEYWAPVVAAYTGCRAGELGGMKLSEVRLDARYPHLIIRPNEYRLIKNGRTRSVPILDALIHLGFDRYVERIAKTGADRLFPDWTARKRLGGGDGEYPAWSNARLLRAFNRTVIPATLGNSLSAEARREVTFHSFRGSFKAMLGITNNIAINIVHEVVGHAKADLDSRYIGEVTIEETYPVIHRCNYRELIIPRLLGIGDG